MENVSQTNDMQDDTAMSTTLTDNTLQSNTAYSARPIEDLDPYPLHNGGIYYRHRRIGIFHTHVHTGEQQIGEYVRNYTSFYDTFAPFRVNGKDYALYSKDYCYTRVMTLPDCVDIGGESDYASHFCPTGYFIPERDQYNNFPPIAFVSGCVWGDDTTWKIELFDLSRVEEGILKREARFGYIHLPPKIKIKDAIDMEYTNVERTENHGRYPYVRISTERAFDFVTGKVAFDED